MSNSIPIAGTWFYNQPYSGSSLQGTSPSLQGSSPALQGSSPSLQGSSPNLQPTANPNDYIDPVANGQVLSTNTTVDPAVATAKAAAAQQAALAGQLRGEVTNLVNSIKNIYNTRYGQVDSSAGEQVGKLNERFGNESGDLTSQIANENNALGAAYAGRGTYDSSYRANSVDTITKAGQSQARDIGQELQDNIAKIAAWVSQQKTGFDAEKGGLDTILSHLAESTDPNELTQLRSSLEARIAELNSGGANNNTAAQNASALNAISPTSARTVKLKTTLSQIIAGNADSSQKAAIAQSLIANAGLSPDEQQKLSQAFQSDLSSTEEQPTA